MLFYKTYFWQPRISEILAEKCHETIQKKCSYKNFRFEKSNLAQNFDISKRAAAPKSSFRQIFGAMVRWAFLKFFCMKIFCVKFFFLKIFVSKQNRQFSKFSSNLFLKIFTRQNFVHSVLFWYSAALVLFNP